MSRVSFPTNEILFHFDRLFIQNAAFWFGKGTSDDWNVQIWLMSGMYGDRKSWICKVSLAFKIKICAHKRGLNIFLITFDFQQHFSCLVAKRFSERGAVLGLVDVSVLKAILNELSYVWLGCYRRFWFICRLSEEFNNQWLKSNLWELGSIVVLDVLPISPFFHPVVEKDATFVSTFHGILLQPTSLLDVRKSQVHLPPWLVVHFSVAAYKVTKKLKTNAGIFEFANAIM